MNGFYVSNLSSSIELESLFDNLNRNYKSKSQCYERAHIWSYQLYQNNNLNTAKVFIFFTNKYKREINGQWWFHVAPAINLNYKLHVLDPEFLADPHPFEAWKNGAIDHAVRKLTKIKIDSEAEINRLQEELSSLNVNTRYGRNRKQYIDSRIEWLNNELTRRLIKDKKVISVTKANWPYKDDLKKMVKLECPIITKYSDYEKAQEEEYCYIQFANMYIWAPLNLEKTESANENLSEFSSSEVYTSYKRGFRGRIPYRLN